MSLKEQYIKMRNNNTYNIKWFYDYWLEQGGSNISYQDFETHLFHDCMYDQHGNIVLKKQKDISPFLNTIDKKYNLTLLLDKNNNFIKIVV